MAGSHEMTRVGDQLIAGQQEYRGVSGMLGRLWVKILVEANMLDQSAQPGISGRLDAYIDDYVFDHNDEDAPISIQKRLVDRTNLRKQLFAPSMTWKVLYKGICILKTVRLDVSLRLHMTDGRKVTVEHVFYTGARSVKKNPEFEAIKDLEPDDDDEEQGNKGAVP